MAKTQTQDEIKFINSYHTHQSGYCRECDFKSIGQVLHHIHIYSKRIDLASTVKVGIDDVHYGRDRIATFEFDYTLEIPVFKFLGEYEYLNDIQENYLQGLRKIYTGKEILALGLVRPNVRVIEFPISERYCHKGKVGSVQGKRIFVGAFFDFDDRWKVQLA